MKKVLQMGSAFIGIIVGAGFASGQEVLQYFTSFGLIGTAAAFLATIFFSYLGMTLTRLGSRMQTKSHKDAIYQISGRYLGIIVDYVIIFTLFGVGVVMVAGAGSIVDQQLGMPSIVGALLMAVLVYFTAMLKVGRVVAVIGSVTPLLIIAVILLSIYSAFTMDGPLAALDAAAKQQPSALPNWFLSAVNYVSFNIALGASMSLVMGGAEPNERTAALGGLTGGFGLGILILLSHLAIFSKVETAAQFDMPLLKIVDDISPVLGLIYFLILFGMIFNTAVSMFFAFGARFTETGTKKFKGFILISLTAAFAASFVGFTDLVAFFYPLIGYMGLFLIGALIYSSLVTERRSKKKP
ncbi:YkvI family membrane protein [Sediminibacillus albus]|uniref:Uncharacterized membrane protein YkvI n=1 Tax=Sediminibacillus albus TaxID=407036 RepID=A0A1G8WJY2_9BACI|nr:hypothetical protein [Sediminibacillus albus]SDJ78669.1 Uncharacterized membrane protein YkvI [Sediminibacillus albus]